MPRSARASLNSSQSSMRASRDRREAACAGSRSRVQRRSAAAFVSSGSSIEDERLVEKIEDGRLARMHRGEQQLPSRRRLRHPRGISRPRSARFAQMARPVRRALRAISETPSAAAARIRSACGWSAAISGSNRRMDSISSPKNSMRTGCVLLGREHIQDAAADRILARHLDRIVPLVADAFEVRGEIVERHFVVARAESGELPVVWRGFGARKSRRHRRERDAAVARRPAGRARWRASRESRRGATCSVRAAHRAPAAGVEQARIAGRDQIGESLQQREQRFGLLVAVDHDQLRPARRADAAERHRGLWR